MTGRRLPRTGAAPVDRRAAPSTAVAEAQSALESLIDETRALFHRLTVAAKEVHRQGEMSAGRRGVLRSLDRLGLQTVPQMARARPVSRQLIQTLVNELAKEGHVEFVDNPAHKRSHLVRLTPKGTKLVEDMSRQEAKLLKELNIEIPAGDLRSAAAVLTAVRQLFESEQWRRLSRNRPANPASTNMNGVGEQVSSGRLRL